MGINHFPDSIGVSKQSMVPIKANMQNMQNIFNILVYVLYANTVTGSDRAASGVPRTRDRRGGTVRQTRRGGASDIVTRQANSCR